MSRAGTELVHVGKYAAEVDVMFLDEDQPLGPFLSVEDAQKVEAVQKALEQGELKAAARLARVYELVHLALERLEQPNSGLGVGTSETAKGVPRSV